jgi:hypothetical protein
MDVVGLTFTTTDCDVLPVQPLPSVTVTVNVPAVVVLIDAVVAPVLHKYELKPEDAVSIEVAPWQMEKLPPIAGVGLLFIITDCETDPVQPLALVTVTV